MKQGPVLLIDDEPVVLRVNAAAVRHFGFDAITTESVEDGIEMVRAYQPALVISDVQMPGMDGYDMVDSLVRQGVKSMPVIFLTGYNDRSVLQKGLEAGGDDFVAKGGSIKILRKRIAFWMTTGFPELPKDIRRRALTIANQVRGAELADFLSETQLDKDIIERVGSRLADEMKPLNNGYGNRLVDRICYLGRLSCLILDESNRFGDYLRFPDYIREITNYLNTPWATDLWPLLKSFEDWTKDPRFVYAGNDGLRHFQDYAWFSEGHELFE